MVHSDRTLVPRIADLARLALTVEEEKRLAKEFEDILSYVSQVQEVDASEEPLTTTISGVQHVLRNDVAASSSLTEELLACAPDVEKRSVRVPPILSAS
ncbi:MAG: glutamyl-tRNA(Gln) and/or aspartyl-tRNA(Asn) amidotransferase subunit C [Parcubacteria group bacterium Gr01-1014_106]|nr:MAG: glutamyl-tRNA(Gln) and/or aspartyl-tRNA(Asn) amidotransferase subunit C [Parcubacteria group bacterium Gr01-1014_106]